MKKFMKYWFIFLASSLVSAGGVVIMSTFVDDRKAFSQTLSDIGAFGSFLGGVATMVAAVAAVIGVNSWIDQIKLGPYLNYIWGAKVSLRKINSQNMNWYVFKYNFRQPSNIPDDKRDKIIRLIDESRKQLEIDFAILEDQFNHIDQIIDKNDYLWANKCSLYKLSWQKIDEYLSKHPKPDMTKNSLDDILADNIELARLNSDFHDGYNLLCSQLDELEEKYTKAM